MGRCCYATKEVSLTAEHWVITATGYIHNDDTSDQLVDCLLRAADVTIAELDPPIELAENGVPGYRVPVALTGAASLSGAASGEFMCQGGNVRKLIDPSVTAIRVAALDEQ